MVSPLPRRNGSSMWYEGNGPSSLCAGVRNGPVNGASPPRLAAAGGSSHTIQGNSSRVACGTNAGVASCGSQHSPPRRISKTSGMSPATATSSFLDTSDSTSTSLRQLVRQHPTSSIPNDRRGNTAVASSRQSGWSANAGVPLPSNLVHQRRGVPSEACYVGGSMGSRAPTTSGSDMSSPRRMSAQISSDCQGSCTGFLDIGDHAGIHPAATSADSGSYGGRSSDSASIPTSHASSRQARRRHTQDAVFNRAEAPPDLRRATEAASTSAILGTRSGSVCGGTPAPQVRSVASQRIPGSTCPEYAPTPQPTRMVCTPPSRSNATSSLNSSPVGRPDLDRGRIELHLAERLFPEGSCSTDTNSFSGQHSSQTEVEEASTSADECPTTARTSGHHYQVHREERSSVSAQQGNRTRHHRQRTSADNAQREAAPSFPQRNATREGLFSRAEREMRQASSRGGASNPMALTREQRRDTTDRPLPMSLEEAEGPPLQFRRVMQTSQPRLPPAPNFPPQAAVAPEPIEKDQKLVELLQLANMSGLGDVDPEHASSILESLGWDVPEALRRLSGISGRDAATGRRTEGRRRGGGNNHGDLSEFDLLQLQEEEYNRVFAHEDRRANNHHRRNQAEASQWDEDFPDDLDDIDSGSDGLHPGDLLHDFPEHFDSGIPRAGRLRARALREEDPATQLLGSAMLRRGNALAFEHGIFDAETEALHVHALLNVLIRSQDEADLQDALRRSSDEAYSGGFSVPPAEEAAVQRMTTTSQFCEGDAKGQCSVCLMDFEVGDSLRTMQCSHRFHMACIDQWLAQSGQCPVCKKQVGIDH